MRFSEFEQSLVRLTERFLSWRKRRRLLKKAKQKRKNQIVDWVQALLWAAMVVLLINQYLLQAYAVPTGSMEDTIIGEDRLFVDKIVYGPELIPGFAKMPGLAPARRGDIIVFVNPNYRQEMGRDVSGFEELTHRLLYMLTLTLVNLDRTPDGQVAKHFLVKRLMGQPGEQLRMRDGRVEVKAGGEETWTAEDDLKRQYAPLDYVIQKKFYPFDAYGRIKENIVQQTYLQAGVAPRPLQPGTDVEYIKRTCQIALGSSMSVAALKPEELDFFYRQVILQVYGLYNPDKETWAPEKINLEYEKVVLRSLGVKEAASAGADNDAETHRRYKKAMLAYNLVPKAKADALTPDGLEKAYQALPVKYPPLGAPAKDEYFEDYWHYRTKLCAAPYDGNTRHQWARRALGWYIPTDRFFPMGDNRDNSKDARYFGSVRLQSLLGKSLFRFWPIPRMGEVK